MHERTVQEILRLSSLLPEEEAKEFADRAHEQSLREDAHEAEQEIARNLNVILRELRNVLPNYETLTIEDFDSDEPIDAVTIGRTVFHLEQDQIVSIPTGTRIVKEQGGGGCLLRIEIGSGIMFYVRASNFPKFGIRVQPRSQSEGEAGE